MTKKIYRFVLIVPILAIFLAPFLFNAPVFADDNAFEGRTGNSCQGFLGLTSWDCNVNISDQDSLVNGIVQIAVNVLTDITVLAAYLVLGYTIYGGYLYIFAGGDPGKVATGKKTLSQAFIGLAIVMSANLIMNSIRFALMGSSGAFNCELVGDSNVAAGTNCIDANNAITGAIQWFIGIAGAVATIFVVYGGISYTTSGGDPGKLQKAKQMIIYALIGMAVVGLAEIITAFVSGLIRDADNNAATSQINETIISKEIHEENI